MLNTVNQSAQLYYHYEENAEPQNNSKVLLSVHGAGIVFKDPNYINSQFMTSTLFEYIVDGKGYIEFDGTRYEVEAGDCVVIRDAYKENKKLTYYSSKRNPYVKLWFIAHGKFVDGIFNAFNVSNYVNIKKVNLHSVFEKFLSDIQKESYSFSLTTHTILDIMTAMFVGENTSDVKNYDINADIKCYITEKLQSPFKTCEISKYFGMTESSFKRYFKKNFGITYHKYVMNEKMNASKKMLAESNLSVTSVASAFGFCDQSYFSAAFKKHFGVYPSEYRKSQ